jgi:hypothetical protein
MLYPFALQDFEDREKDDFQVQEKGAVLPVILVKTDFNRDRQLVSAVDLRPAGKAIK